MLLPRHPLSALPHAQDETQVKAVLKAVQSPVAKISQMLAFSSKILLVPSSIFVPLLSTIFVLI